MNIRKSVVGILVVVLSAAIFSGCKAPALTRDDVVRNDFAVAVIDSTVPVMASDLYIRLANSNLLEEGGILDSSFYFDTLKAIILDSIISLEAGDVNLKEDLPLYSTYQLRYHDFYINYLYQHLILDSIKVDSAIIDSFYRTRPEQFSYREQVRARQLAISAEGYRFGNDSALYADYTMEQLDSIAREKIFELKAEIDSGADLGQLAKEHSMNMETARKAGELGYFFRNIYNKEFEEVAFSLPVGTISQPFKTPDGWHIVEVIDHVEAGLADLIPEVYQAAARQYSDEMARELAGKFMDSLLETTEIVFNDSALSLNIHTVPDTVWAATINDIDTITFFRLPDFLHNYKGGQEMDTITLPFIHEALSFNAQKYILMQAGDELGFGEDPEVAAKRDELYHRYSVDLIWKSSWDIGYKPPESLIIDYYERNIDDFVFKKPVYVQHIIVEDSVFGEFLRDQALSGVDFLELAKENYPGAEEIRVAAADLGYIGPEEMPDNFYRTAMITPVKDVSHPVRTEWGYHIIKVIDKRYNRTLEQVRASIVDNLKRRHEKVALINWKQEKMDGHLIEYNLDRIERIRLASKERR